MANKVRRLEANLVWKTRRLTILSNRSRLAFQVGEMAIGQPRMVGEETLLERGVSHDHQIGPNLKLAKRYERSVSATRQDAKSFCVDFT